MKSLNRWVSVFVSLVLVLTLGIFAKAAPQETSKAKIYAGYEVSVLMITRMKDWSSGGNRFVPKDGKHEFAVLRLHVRPLEKQKAFLLTSDQVGIRAADGKDYEIALKKYSVSLPANGSVIELPFAVPVGAQFESLRLGSITFDLTKTSEMKPKTGN